MQFMLQSTDTMFNCCTSGTAHDAASIDICLVIKTYSYITTHTKVLQPYVQIFGYCTSAQLYSHNIECSYDGPSQKIVLCCVIFNYALASYIHLLLQQLDDLKNYNVKKGIWIKSQRTTYVNKLEITYYGNKLKMELKCFYIILKHFLS